MSIAWRDYAWGKDGPTDANEHHVFLFLAERADAAGKSFPSLPVICEGTRLCKNTVRRALRDLETVGYLTFQRGRGRGNRSTYQLHKKVQGTDLLSAGNEHAKRVKSDTVPDDLKGSNQTPEKGQNEHAKRVKSGVSPTPPYKSNRQLTVSEPSAGEAEEFMAGTYIWQELGISAGPFDVRTLAEVIHFEAKRARADVEQTTNFLLAAAQRAMERGERVNAFWFRDRQFTDEGKRNGKATSESKQAATVSAVKNVIARIRGVDGNGVG